ncbi:MULTISPECIES: NADH-quinone oxidoreductase subunit N [Halolamina]|uniref:NADH-quinone oxidoreductase subunit N n=1 Tax=Halolamina pelagica TaxID=699431 RepID=A0A1I5NPF5_9EURY|nr:MULTISPECIES: NADH-quinone oxidoreductase subunit N [Halolamina]NHX36394.1 NADH-quinone oxidoreductase subunit N [Halolamina sp. R1-12]SFP23101.1 NADH-quinone oxidoreductase subunit N [Halolamina pelagica]
MVTAPPLTPTFLLGLTALAVLTYDSVWPDSTDGSVLTGISVVGSLASLAAAGWFLTAGTGLATDGVSLYADAVVVDGMSLFFTALFAAVTILVSLASFDYFAGKENQGELFGLMLLAATGMSLMASANSLATAFVALELVSLPSYALVAFLKNDRGSSEAGLKYFLIGALSSAIFVFGVSLIYGATGSLLLPDVAAAFESGLGDRVGIAGVGVLMVAGGVAFKAAAVPFHFWAPEAYEGAPAPVSAFLSSASKAAGFALAFRVFVVGFPLGPAASAGIDWALLFQVLAVATMVLGNFAAATQDEVKRMLAYSSIGHAGYVLIGLAALSAEASTNGDVMGAAMAHLFVYGFMNTGAFLFVALAENWGVGRRFEDYNGLGAEKPFAAVAMTAFLFSLAGVPPLGGFFSKLFLFAGAVEAGLWWLVVIAVINSSLSLFYYSRVVRALWFEEGDHDLSGAPTALYAALAVALIGTVVLLPGFGPVIETAQQAATALFA